MKIIGIMIMLAGIALGLYVGIGILLVGGIIDIIEGIKHDFAAIPIAWGIAKIILATPLGWATAGVLWFTGLKYTKTKY